MSSSNAGSPFHVIHSCAQRIAPRTHVLLAKRTRCARGAPGSAPASEKGLLLTRATPLTSSIVQDRQGVVDVNVGSSVSGYPISFAAAGKQYIAVITGPSLVANSDARVTPELMQGNAPNVFVFSLP